MIAYDHYIQFPFSSKNTDKLKESFSNIITLKETPSFKDREKLKYGTPFTSTQGRDLMLYTDREFSRTQNGQLWAFDVKDVVTFFWNSNTSEIKYTPSVNFTDDLLKYWCLHIVLPLFFTLEETYDFLHAGAVELGKKPILFVAESFGGKSTMTDFFIKQGHTLISDDKVGIYEKSNQFFAIPSHPHYRPYRKMEDLGHFVQNTSTAPKPIHAIYILKRDASDKPISISEIQGIEKFKSLRYNSEINFPPLKLERFNFLGRLTKVVPVYQVVVPWDINRLEEVYNAIFEHTLKK